MEQDRVLTPEEVEQIRREARDHKNNTYAAVAKRWNIDQGHVKYIANREDK